MSDWQAKELLVLERVAWLRQNRPGSEYLGELFDRCIERTEESHRLSAALMARSAALRDQLPVDDAEALECIIRAFDAAPADEEEWQARNHPFVRDLSERAHAFMRQWVRGSLPGHTSQDSLIDAAQRTLLQDADAFEAAGLMSNIGVLGLALTQYRSTQTIVAPLVEFVSLNIQLLYDALIDVAGGAVQKKEKVERARAVGMGGLGFIPYLDQFLSFIDLLRGVGDLTKPSQATATAAEVENFARRYSTTLEAWIRWSTSMQVHLQGMEDNLRKMYPKDSR